MYTLKGNLSLFEHWLAFLHWFLDPRDLSDHLLQIQPTNTLLQIKNYRRLNGNTIAFVTYRHKISCHDFCICDVMGQNQSHVAKHETAQI